MQEKIQNISPIKQRILSFASTLGISKRDFYLKIGVSRGTLESKTGITEDIMAKFIATYPNVNIDWLMTGNGSMTKPVSIVMDQNIKAEHVVLGTNIGFKPIPLVFEKVAAGFGSTDFCIQDNDVKDYYVIPKFRHCNVDFMIEVFGDSMIPHLYPGDIIACSILRDRKFIQWNKVHVLATREQGLLVKRIFSGDDETNYIAVSENKDYPPFKIPLCDITGVALVVGSVSLE